MIEKFKNWWLNFEKEHPAASKWVREGGLFILFSNVVTVFQYFCFTFLPGLIGLELAGVDVMWPGIRFELFGIETSFTLLGYPVQYDAAGAVVIGGGLGYMIALYIGSFLAQCINFPLQRNITFRSHGNPWWQAMWYFIAWLVINPLVNAVNVIWVDVASILLPPWLYNIGTTFLMGSISMVVFFFVFKIIFPEGEAKPAEQK